MVTVTVCAPTGRLPGASAGLVHPAQPFVTSSAGVAEELRRLPVGVHQDRPEAEVLCHHPCWEEAPSLHPLGVGVVLCLHPLGVAEVLCHRPEEAGVVPSLRPWEVGVEDLFHRLWVGGRQGRLLSGDHQGRHLGA